MITPFKRLIATLAFILPVIALAASPAMATTKAKTTKTHHVASVHKTAAHKTTHAKKIVKPAAS